MRLVILALLLASACTDAIPSRVRLVTDQPTLELALGANAWHGAGLTAGYDVGELDIPVVFVPNLRNADGNKVNGTTDRDTLEIKIEARLRGVALQHVIAHEIGHAVFGVDHLEHGDGIMRATPGDVWIIEPSAADLELVGAR